MQAPSYNCSSARLAPVDVDPSIIMNFFTQTKQPGIQNILLIPREGLPGSAAFTADTTSSSSSSSESSGSGSGSAAEGGGDTGSLQAVLRVTDVLLCPEEACVTEWTSEFAAEVGFNGQVSWRL